MNSRQTSISLVVIFAVKNKSKVFSIYSDKRIKWEFKLRESYGNSNKKENIMFKEINTQQVLDCATQVMDNHGVGYSMHRLQLGKREAVALRLKDQLTDPTGSGILPQLIIYNKNDGATACRIFAGIFRLVCRNGLVAGYTTFSQRLVHLDGPKLNGFLDNMPQIIESALAPVLSGDLEDELFRLQSIEVSEALGIDAIGSLPVSDSVKHVAIYRWLTPRRIEDTGRNLYVLLNIVNEALRGHTNLNNGMPKAVSAFEKNLALAEHLELLTTGTIAA